MNKMQKMFSGVLRSCRTSIIAALALALLAGCSSLQFSGTAEELQLTSVTASPTNEYHPGKFIWHDLLTPDVAAARKFYGELFGWSFEQQGRYTEITNQGRKVGGMVEISPQEEKEAEAYWLAYMSVSDVDRAMDFLTAQGGVVHKGPVDMENRGRGVLVSDPQGAQLLLLHAADGDPEDVEPLMGDWLWNEIWTNVPEMTFTFYQTLGEYESSIDGNNYQVLQNEGKWRAGIRHVFEADFNVRWVPSVRVEDPELMVDKVESLGGVVWLRPDEPPSNGNTALISDSTGALLMIQRWPGQTASEGQ